MAHWYVVGASPERLNEIREAGHLVDAFDGPLDRDEQFSLFRRIANAAPDSLWLTWASLDPPDLDSLRRLRVAQPSLNIIIEIPADWTPPNADLAQLVGLGIYGIVPESTAFVTLPSQWTYADAAVWQGTVRTFDEPDPEPKEKIVEKVIEKEVVKRVATSTRPTVVAVAGAVPGVGTTTLAAAVAHYLAEQGWAVALAEYAERAALERLSRQLRGLSVFPHPAPRANQIAARRQYAYVVADMGVANWAAISETRPDLVLWVLPGVRHRMPGLAVPVGLGPEDPLMGVVAPGVDATAIADIWSKKHGIPAIVWSDHSIGPMLAVVLADPPTGWLKWFPRRRRAYVERHPPALPQTTREAIEAGDDARDPHYLSPYARQLISQRRTRPWSLRRAMVMLWNVLVVSVLISIAAWMSVLAVETHVVHPDAWTALGARIYTWDVHRLAALWPWLDQSLLKVGPNGPPLPTIHLPTQ